MTLDIFFKLLVLVAVVGAGWYAGRTPLMAGPEPVKAISTLAFYLLIPALLFRTMATVDLAHLPWATLVAFFGPTTAWVLVVYGYHGNSGRRRRRLHRRASPRVRIRQSMSARRPRRPPAA